MEVIPQCFLFSKLHLTVNDPTLVLDLLKIIGMVLWYQSSFRHYINVALRVPDRIVKLHSALEQ